MIRSLATLWPYFRQQRARLLALVVMSGLFSATTVLQPWPMKLLVDYALGDAGMGAGMSASAMIWFAAGATLGLFLINVLLDVVVSRTWMATGQRMVYDLAADVFERLLHVPFPRQRRSVGDLLERLSGDTWSVYTVASDLLVSPLQNALTLIGIIVVAWQLDPQLTIVSLITAPIVAGSVVYFGPKLKRRAKQGREIRSDLAAFVHQTVTSIPLVQAYGAETRNLEHFENIVDDVVTVTQRGVLVNKSFSLLNGLAASGGRAVVLLAGGWQVFEGNLSVGSLLVFMAYVRTLQGCCENLLKIYSKLKTSEASIERLSELLVNTDQLPQPAASSAASPPIGGSSIGFRDASFAYGDGAPALIDVSFEIEPSERVAVVGASGAGKSTLIALLLRLIDVNHGSVEIDGVDVRQLGLDDLRSRIAVVLQEPYLLPMSVAENIALGNRNATRPEIVAAAITAGAHEFIERLPNGYDTVIGERGSTLSGGQRHRIAIARAFVRHASLVILDEPTAALDAATEAELMTSFRRLTEGRTSIVISHRLSTIRDADRIIVLDRGRVVEAGTHADLLARRGHFYGLHRAAFFGAVDGQVCA
jgi:ATP-binding cassette subfamily B protein/subfamily B ATP-binding cassette protein MsbA